MRFRTGVGPISCWVLLAISGAIPAFALTWYSYREPGGRVVVVDDPSKVPAECRDSVRAEQVGRKKAPAPASPPPMVSAASESEDPDLADSSPSSGRLEAVPEDLVVVAAPQPADGARDSKNASETPEMRAEREFTASAGLCLQDLSGLQDRGELIWAITRRLGPTRPEVRFQHLQGLATLAGPWMTWAAKAENKKYREWLERVNVLIEQYRTLFYTISQRLAVSPQSLANELPVLLNRIRTNLEWVKQNQPIPLASSTAH